jgi:hypothetical protein
MVSMIVSQDDTLAIPSQPLVPILPGQAVDLDPVEAARLRALGVVYPASGPTSTVVMSGGSPVVILT